MYMLPPTNIQRDYEIWKPDFFVLELLNTSTNMESFTFNELLMDKQTQKKYDLLATINNPYPTHFNCSIYEPCLKDGVILNKK